MFEHNKIGQTASLWKKSCDGVVTTSLKTLFLWQCCEGAWKSENHSNSASYNYCIWDCWDIVWFVDIQSLTKLLRPCPQMGWLRRTKQSTPLLLHLPSIQSWGVCCFLQVAWTAAQQHIAWREWGTESFIFSFLSWQNIREAPFRANCLN